MTHEEAVELIRGGVHPGRATWADLGAGTGTFTRALAELLGPDATIVAVDRSRRAARALRRVDLPAGASFRVRREDFSGPLELPPLDGVLMANALHFEEDQAEIVTRLRDHLVPGGCLLLVEYDLTRANRWVPHPVPPGRFRELAAGAGLEEPLEVGRRPSAFHRAMYAAVARRPGSDAPP